MSTSLAPAAWSRPSCGRLAPRVLAQACCEKPLRSAHGLAPQRAVHSSDRTHRRKQHKVAQPFPAFGRSLRATLHRRSHDVVNSLRSSVATRRWGSTGGAEPTSWATGMRSPTVSSGTVAPRARPMVVASTSGATLCPPRPAGANALCFGRSTRTPWRRSPMRLMEERSSWSRYVSRHGSSTYRGLSCFSRCSFAIHGALRQRQA